MAWGVLRSDLIPFYNRDIVTRRDFIGEDAYCPRCLAAPRLPAGFGLRCSNFLQFCRYRRIFGVLCLRIACSKIQKNLEGKDFNFG